MAHKGFLSSSTTFIRQIRHNLSEGRYSFGESGFPIIKELVQNADDAVASVMHVGTTVALTHAKHPLLQSPGMYVVNDGVFEKHDAANIRRFGENSKAIDATKIGKFGLGLKSIFHLCEAFFFLGPEKPGLDEHYVVDLLNPWSGDQEDDFHGDWDEICLEDQKLLLEALRPFFGGKACFCLWIPLRQKHHLAGNEPINHFYPGDANLDRFTSTELPREIATLVPFLSNLRCVKGWSGVGNHALPQFEVRLDDCKARRRPFAELSLGTPHSFDGNISIASADGHKSSVSFVVTELNPADAELSMLESDEHWPSDLGRDPNTGRARTIRDKSIQHAGICLTMSRNRQDDAGRLSISWAVFLPLGEPETIPLREASFNVSLSLHGYFFVDAGRNRPIGLHDLAHTVGTLTHDEDLRRRWNQRLSQAATLPLLPQAISRLVAESEAPWEDVEIAALSRAIQASSLFARFGEHICRDDCWAELYLPNGSRCWRLFSANETLVELPPPRDGVLPGQVFSELSQIVTELNVTSKAAPRLVFQKVDVWPFDAVQRLLASISPYEVLADASKANYFADFLDLLAEQGVLSQHADAVARIVRLGMVEFALLEKLDHSAHVKRVLERIPSSHRIAIKLVGDHAAYILSELSRHPIDLVFIPQELDSPADPGQGCLETHHAAEILNTMALWQKQEKTPSYREAVSVLSAQLLHKVIDRAKLLSQISELSLFLAKDCQERRDRLTTWVDLERRRSRKTLFVLPSPDAYSVQKALARETISLISKDCFEALFPGESTSQCTAAMQIKLLARESPPELAPSPARVDLFRRLRDYRSEARERELHYKCVRYLLHGEPDQLHTEARLLSADSGRLEVWRRITSISLAEQNAQWRLIDSIFAKMLTGDHREQFDVVEIGPESAALLIREAGPLAFQQLKPSADEYSILLAGVDDDELCRKLPIHEDLSGRHVPIDNRCYWESDVRLPDELSHAATILRKSRNETTWRRQRDFTRPLGDADLVDLVLHEAEPGKHWEVVMDSLARCTELSPGLLARLCSRAWLPGIGGASIRPENIIDLPAVADEVARQISATPGIFFEPGMLQSELLDHAAYASLRRMTFPVSERALAMLGEILADDPANHLGPLGPEGLRSWLELAADIPTDLVPCAGLIHHAADSYFASVNRLLGHLTQSPISHDRLQMFVDYFRQVHRSEQNRKRRECAIAVFDTYVQILVKDEGNTNRFRDQELLTRAGGWRSAHELCFDIEGIADEHLVAGETAAALGYMAPQSPESSGQRDISSLLSTQTLRAINGMVEGFFSDGAGFLEALPQWRKHWESTAERLASYFSSWKGLVSDEEIGGFLSLFGDDPSVRALAQQYLGRNRTLAQTRASLGLGFDLSAIRVIAAISHGRMTRVPNLFGELINVRKAEIAKSLFVGFGTERNPFPMVTIVGQRVFCICLTEVVNGRDGAELSKLLRDSTARILTLAYGCSPSGDAVSCFWEDLAQSDQLDIRVAQERILENGFLILDQLGMRSLPQIEAVLDKWDAAQRLSAEQKSTTHSRSLTKGRNAAQELAEAKRLLQALLEEDGDVHAKIVEAVRRRVAEYYQYTQASVPFEVFQNADDASVELAKHFPVAANQGPPTDTFFMQSKASTVTLAHFGRRINQYPPQGNDDGIGFDNDLWKMLVLSLSNKGRGHDDEVPEVTGKFGLGFKSCYLVSDRPRLLSGRLSFEVTGGMYPRRLTGNDRAALDEFRGLLGGHGAEATILQLPLSSVDAQEILGDFQRLAHVLVVFARRIRRCVLNEGLAEVKWDPVPLPSVPGCFTGAVTPMLSAVKGVKEPSRVLLFDSDAGSLLLTVDARRFGYFGDGIPTIWVTAPTREHLKVGFLVNGPFALDVGRAQLARDHLQNEQTIERLAVAFGEQLEQLFTTTARPNGWEGVRDALRMAKDAEPYEFWESLFERIGIAVDQHSDSCEPAGLLLRSLLWDEKNGAAAAFYLCCPSLPTRLTGNHRKLVHLSKVKYASKGLLEEDASVFLALSGWETVRNQAPPGTVVSYRHVSLPLSRLAPSLVSAIRPLTLTTVIRWELRHGSCADPETAARLGTVISRRTLENVGDSSERQELRNLLDSIEFKGRDNLYHSAKELLLGHPTELERDDRREDERSRAVFAPQNRVLSELYQGRAAVFFDVCRDTLEAPVRQMAEWVLDAGDQHRQIAALQYLAYGQLGSGLIAELKQRGVKGTWLAGLASSSAFCALDEMARARLLELLPREARPTINWETLAGDNQLPEIDTKQTLLAIYDWWKGVRDRPQSQFQNRSYIEEYERRTYPEGQAPTHLNDYPSETELEWRKEWMTLFILGLSHTMGGFQHEQHRGFLSYCQRNGALRVFAEHKASADKWISVLEKYFDAQTDSSPFLHWMRQFVGIFAVSRNMENYVESFLSMRRRKSPFPLTAITEPATDNLAPTAAPSISRVLGMGACFVVRELFRHGAITNPIAARHAYVPIKGVRTVLEQIGWTLGDRSERKWELSTRLHAFVSEHIGPEKAAFCNDFDIPFQFINESPGLQLKLLCECIESSAEDDGEAIDGF